MSAADRWYEVNQPERIASPALLIYPERVAQNIRHLLNMAGSPDRVRPHVKTCKAAEPIRMMIAAGIHQFKCATIAEAELLASCNAKDILLAYQPVGPTLDRLIALRKTYPNSIFSCLVDQLSAASAIAAKALADGAPMRVWIDINTGMNRTGIKAELAKDLYQLLVTQPGLLFQGLHCYDGHIHQVSLEERKAAVAIAYAPVRELCNHIETSMGARVNVVAGGTPTFPIHLENEEWVCSPGTFIYWDAGYLSFQEQSFLPAAVLLCRVVSMPTAETICVDLGHKAVAAENEIGKRVRFLNFPELVAVGQSEEHLVLSAGKGHRFDIGDLIYALPYHVCPSVALHATAQIIENGSLAGEWITVARNRKLKF